MHASYRSFGAPMRAYYRLCWISAVRFRELSLRVRLAPLTCPREAGNR